MFTILKVFVIFYYTLSFRMRTAMCDRIGKKHYTIQIIEEILEQRQAGVDESILVDYEAHCKVDGKYWSFRAFEFYQKVVATSRFKYEDDGKIKTSFDMDVATFSTKVEEIEKALKLTDKVKKAKAEKKIMKKFCHKAFWMEKPNGKKERRMYRILIEHNYAISFSMKQQLRDEYNGWIGARLDKIEKAKKEKKLNAFREYCAKQSKIRDIQKLWKKVQVEIGEAETAEHKAEMDKQRYEITEKMQHTILNDLNNLIKNTNMKRGKPTDLGWGAPGYPKISYPEFWLSEYSEKYFAMDKETSKTFFKERRKEFKKNMDDNSVMKTFKVWQKRSGFFDIEHGYCKYAKKPHHYHNGKPIYSKRKSHILDSYASSVGIMDLSYWSFQNSDLGELAKKFNCTDFVNKYCKATPGLKEMSTITEGSEESEESDETSGDPVNMEDDEKALPDLPDAFITSVVPKKDTERRRMMVLRRLCTAEKNF